MNSKGRLIGDYTLDQFSVANSFSRNIFFQQVGRVAKDLGISAVNYTTKANLKEAEVSKQAEIAGAFMSTLNIIQDGTDILQKAERTGVSQGPELNPAKKGFWDLMKITEVSEYYNQVPTILAVAMNYKMPDGNPIFNGYEFPYHEVVDGVFKLKEEYLTKFKDVSPQEMIDKYETFDTTEATNWVVNLKNNIITKRNGDYTDSGAVLGKATSEGKSVFTFANWIYGILDSVYHSERLNLNTGNIEQGYINRLASSSEGMALGIPTLLTGAVSANLMSIAMSFAFSSVPAMLIPVATVAGGMYLISKNKSGQKVDKSEVNIEGDSLASFIGRGLKTASYNMSVGTMLPLIHLFTGMYNRVAKNDKSLIKFIGADFDYSFGGKIDDNTALALAKASQQQQILNMLTMLAGVNLILWGSIGAEEDEPEPKTIGDGEENPYREIQNQKNIDLEWQYKLKYLMQNIVHRSYADAALTLDPQSMIYSLIGDEKSSKVLSPGAEFGSLIYTLSNMNTDEVQGGGFYEGDSKFKTGLRKTLIPPMFRNIDKMSEDNWMFGFETAAQDYQATTKLTDMIGRTDYKKDLKESRKEKKELRTK
jgi:hypothetical protein